MSNKPIFVTSPLMPDYDEFIKLIHTLWDSRILTNDGSLLQNFEQALAEYLGEQYISVYTNGTLPLLAAFKALNLSGEVITTPYTFIATSHALRWCGLEPVYADIDPITGDIAHESIEKLISSKTSAILGVHVYGRPCRNQEIEDIATRNGLRVVYDAAHAFGVKKNGQSITKYGDIATLSFHATKVFNCLEGGAVVCRDKRMKEELDKLRNFGIDSEIEISAVGINAKLDEMRAAFGLLNLKKVDYAIEKRKNIYEKYYHELSNAQEVQLPPTMDDIRYNYSHFPIVAKDKITRERIYQQLCKNGIYPRRYFYPLVTDFKPYCDCRGADDTPNARALSDRVLCLPIHTELIMSDVNRICDIVKRS